MAHVPVQILDELLANPFDDLIDPDAQDSSADGCDQDLANRQGHQLGGQRLLTLAGLSRAGTDGDTDAEESQRQIDGGSAG